MSTKLILGITGGIVAVAITAYLLSDSSAELKDKFMGMIGKKNRDSGEEQSYSDWLSDGVEFEETLIIIQ
jgi:hypothetical protein